MRIAVLGATGNVGREVVDQLAAAGHAVQALSRSGHPDERAEVTAHAVDLSDGASLGGALDGVEAAFLMAGYDDAGILAALAAAGTERVTLLSSGAAGTAAPENAVAAYHVASERAIEQSGLAFTFLRPNSFTSNVLRWSDAIESGDPVVLPFADVPIAMNDPADLAAVAVRALTSADLDGQVLRLTGPEALLPGEQVAIVGEVLGRELPFRAQPDDEARAEMSAQMPAEYVDAFFRFFRGGETDETTVLPTIADVLGRPAGTLRGWVERNADALR